MKEKLIKHSYTVSQILSLMDTPYLEDEPTYDPNIHLELELPKNSLSLS
jgi:hypothetical protein